MNRYCKKKLKEMRNKEFQIVLFRGSQELNRTTISISYLKAGKIISSLFLIFLLCFCFWAGIKNFQSYNLLNTAYQYELQQVKTIQIVQQQIESMQANIQALSTK